MLTISKQTQNPLIEQDISLKDLPQSVIDTLKSTKAPWLNSFEFCTGYSAIRPERILLFLGINKSVKPIYYRVRSVFGMIRILEIVGFPNIDDNKIEELRQKYKAHLALINRLEQAIKPDEEWYTNKKNIYHKDYVAFIQMSSAKEDYLNKLNHNKKMQLPKYWHRLNQKCENNIEISYQAKGDIKFEEILTLELLSRERRTFKGRGVDTIEKIRRRHLSRWALTQENGLLITLRHKGKILGGTLSYVYGTESHVVIVAHDASLDYFRVGKLCIWKTLEYFTENGISKTSLGWGRSPFKLDFLSDEYPWTIHIISPYKKLIQIWKLQMSGSIFLERLQGFLATKYLNFIKSFSKTSNHPNTSSSLF